VVLQAGVIEQAGSPLELYHHPQNLFVAGFIGSPKMNFLEAQVAGSSSEGVTVRLQHGAEITVPVEAGRVKGGETVSLGVRPEHLRTVAEAPTTGEVLVAERLGGDTYLYTQITDGVSLVVQADGENPTRVHDRVGIEINGQFCHLFTSDGLAVPHRERHPLANIKDPTAHFAA